ncbi:transposase family protein [Magnetofaba australis]|uniref:Transposase Helix-turn-helix domain-containing protein n=1 Tax=Magnetofaba australis IT-1 TaxID=1434232 RepID=A0A1Y2K7C7_9PROT|nr:transposase family protein [Magnetofaba australis]OSM05227.1 hypothetical protein MAIT1_03392 [Magnetofaba australis IT-1]
MVTQHDFPHLTYQLLKPHTELFTRVCGMELAQFAELAEALRPEWSVLQGNKKVSGRPYRIPDLENHLMALMIYYRFRATYQLIGALYGVNETTAMRRIKCIESLVKGRSDLRRERTRSRDMLIEVAEQLQGLTARAEQDAAQSKTPVAVVTPKPVSTMVKGKKVIFRRLPLEASRQSALV